MRILPGIAVAILGATTPAQTQLVAPHADRHPELADLSTWQLHAELADGAVDKSLRGVFPIGNGRVFGYCGLGDHACTVQGLTGPTYQTSDAWAPEGHFGEQSFEVRADGVFVRLPHQTVARVRGANCVVTEDRDDRGLAFVTLTFAPADSSRLYRIAQIRNQGKTTLRGVELIARAPRSTKQNESTLQVTNASPTRTCRALFSYTADGFVQDGMLVRPFGELAPGATAETVLTIYTVAVGDTQIWVDPTAELVDRSLTTTLQWWRRRLAETATFASDPPRVADLIDDWKVLLLTQRSAANGLFAAMVGDHRCRTRDLAGPMLLCLRYNLWDDARAMLQSIWRATNHYGALREELPLDLDWRNIDPKATDWDAVTIPDGGLGSLVVMLHEWYWRATGDTTLLREHLPLLQRCLDGQRFTAQGLQSFSGAEAHFTMRSLLGDRLADAGDLIAHRPAAGRSALSFDASALYLMANLAMGEILDALTPPGASPDLPAPTSSNTTPTHIDPAYMRRMIEVARLVEGRFWQPDSGRFAPALSPLDLAAHSAPLADSNLRLQWLGWTFASTQKNQQNLRSTLHALWRAPEVVRVGMTPTIGFSTGETQPLLLYSLTDLDDAARDPALAELVRMAGPAGEWGKLYDPEGRPTWSRDPAWPERCQPGASGIAIDAICFALTGIRYACVPSWDNRQQARFRPRLPPGATRFDWGNIRHDGRHLHLHVEQLMAKLTPEEIARQDEMVKAGMLQAKDAKDVHAEHLRFRYRVLMDNPPPDADHIVCAVNLGGDLLIRYLAASLPSFGDSCDPPQDRAHLYPLTADERSGVAKASPTRATPFDTLLFTARADAARRHPGPGVRCIDVGLPLQPTEIAGLLCRDGKALGRRVVFDVGVTDDGPLTGKGAAFWQQPALRDALATFEAAGGERIAPKFAQLWQAAPPHAVTGSQPFAQPCPALAASNWPGQSSQLSWHAIDAGANGYVDLGRNGESSPCVRAAATTVVVTSQTRCVLRVGSACAVQVHVDDKVVLAQPGFGEAAADQTEAALALSAGQHRLIVTLADNGTTAGFYLRLVGDDGLPVAGLQTMRP